MSLDKRAFEDILREIGIEPALDLGTGEFYVTRKQMEEALIRMEERRDPSQPGGGGTGGRGGLA
jgi:hypothetical protein